MNKTTLMCVSFAGLSLAIMLFVKADVQRLSASYNDLQKQHSSLNEDVYVLKAEYAYLSSPDRLWNVAEDLNMKEVGYSEIYNNNQSVNNAYNVAGSVTW